MKNYKENEWSALGIVAYEPIKKKIAQNTIVAKTVLLSNTKGEVQKIPICAFNEKAHTLCALAHKGSTIFAKGTIETSTKITSIQSKVLICLNLKVTEFEVLLREPVNIDNIDYADVVEMYDPESFIDMEEKEND